MTRADLLAQMTSHEFYEWMVLEGIEPFGEKRSDIQAGIIASTMANIFRSKDQQPYDVTKFMPQFEESKPQTPEEISNIFKALQAIQQVQAEIGT